MFFIKKIFHLIISSPHKQKQQTITKQQKRKMSDFIELLFPKNKAKEIRALKPKRRIVRMPRNMFTDERTLTKREQLRAKLRRKQEQKAKAEAEQNKSN
jgi:hypothetical protein